MHPRVRDDPQRVLATARYLPEHYPKFRLIARARSRVEAQALMRLGVATVRELFGSAVEVAELALVEMGEDRAVVSSISERFRRHDEDLLRRMSQVSDREERRQIFSQGRADFLRVLEAEMAEARGTPSA